MALAVGMMSGTKSLTQMPDLLALFKVYVIIYRIHGDFFQQASFEVSHTCTVIYYQQIHVIIHRDIAIVLYHNLLLYFHCQFPVHL